MVSERTTTYLLPHRLAVLSVNKLGAIINSKACLNLIKYLVTNLLIIVRHIFGTIFMDSIHHG